MTPETMNSGNSFIDDNHEGLLNNIDALTFLVRDNWNQNEFELRVRNLIVDLENHFSHEETILKAVGYADLDSHSVKHRGISMCLRIASLDTLDYDDSVQFLVKLRTEVFGHELLEDQNYWPLFDQENSDQDILILWSQELETGDPETDKHHKALINHINRLHMRFSKLPDIDSACKELKLLYEYSKFHFSEEEILLGSKLRPGHKENHESLLVDLDILVNEVQSGKYKLHNIGDYLKYWLINHIQTFDIPSFNRDV